MIDYEDRINRVIDYMDKKNYSTFTLKELSKVACFSEFHFQRIFTAYIGESPLKYINRRKIEKSINLLFHTTKPITDIAHELGFSSSANYSKAFKKHCSITPLKCRKLGKEGYSKTIRSISFKKNTDFKYTVTIENINNLTVAYTSYWGEYDFNISLAWASLNNWFLENNLDKSNSIAFGITYDNPNISNSNKLRYDACISIPQNTKCIGKINKKDIQGGSYATIEYSGKYSGLEELFNSFYSNWLPQSGYDLENKPTLQIHTSQGNKINNNCVKLKVCIPVKRK